MIRTFRSTGVPVGEDRPPPSRSNSTKDRERPWRLRNIPKARRLSLEDMAYLVKNTHYDANSIKSWHKDFTKDCPDGLLRREQTLEMCNKILPSGNSETFVNQIFRIFDKDGDGTIDFREYMLAMDMTKAGNPEQKLRWAFKIYDIDGSGSIDVAEMAEAIRALYIMEGEEQKEAAFLRKAQRLFQLLDADNDGELNVDEFVEGCMKDEDLMVMLGTPACMDLFGGAAAAGAGGGAGD